MPNVYQLTTLAAQEGTKTVIFKIMSSKHIQFSRSRSYLLFPKITAYFSSTKPCQIPIILIITNNTCNHHHIKLVTLSVEATNQPM